MIRYPMVTNGTPQIGRGRGGDTGGDHEVTASGGAGTVLFGMSLSDITLRVALLAGLALIALVAVGWRQPARRRIVSPRDTPGRGDSVEIPEPLGQQARRRILDLASLGGIAVGVAFVVAIAVALVISSLVTNVIERL